jgi:hypothetical protein
MTNGGAAARFTSGQPVFTFSTFSYFFCKKGEKEIPATS